MERTPDISSSLYVPTKNQQSLGRGEWYATVCKWCSAGSQSRPHIRAFSSRTIRRARVYEALEFLDRSYVF